MLTLVKVCILCDKQIMVGNSNILLENDPFAFTLEVLICGGCRSTWKRSNKSKIIRKFTNQIKQLESVIRIGEK